jgi:tetratricopeptide (TPR) repeat protein
VENYVWDWNASEKEYRRAIELNPNYATTHQWYAENLMWRGRFDDALRESEIAWHLDPLSLIIATDQAEIYYYSRQYDQAIERFNAALDMDPNFLCAHMVLCPYIEKGRYQDALSDTDKWTRVPEGEPALWEAQAYANGRSGKLEKAREEVKKLTDASRNEELDPIVFVFANLGVGNKEEGIAWLQKGYAQRSNCR